MVKAPSIKKVTDKLYHIEITLILLPIKNSQATVGSVIQAI
jgi:hypothetical protein